MKASKKDRLVSQLIADCKKLLQDDFSEAKVKQSFIVVKEARVAGFARPRPSSRLFIGRNNQYCKRLAQDS